MAGSYAGRPAAPSQYAIPETIQIHPIDRAQHRPHQMIFRQPLHQRRWHQQQLTTITTNEFSSHAEVSFTRQTTPISGSLATLQRSRLPAGEFCFDTSLAAELLAQGRMRAAIPRIA
jgi:hypothetical protein